MSTSPTYETLRRIALLADLELSFIYPTRESRERALEEIRKIARKAMKSEEREKL